jgi:hypothetical protein
LPEKLGSAQRSGAFMVVIIGMTARIMFKIALVSVISAQAADGFPESFKMLEH